MNFWEREHVDNFIERYINLLLVKINALMQWFDEKSFH